MAQHLIPEVKKASVSPQALRKQLESIQRSPNMARMVKIASEPEIDTRVYKGLTSSEVIADRFTAVYENERVKAALSLGKTSSKDKVIYTLMRIIRSGYEFCVETADRQLKLLQQSAESVMVNPFSPQTTKTSHSNGEAENGSDNTLLHFQWSSAVKAIPAIQQKFMIQILPTIFKSETVEKDVREFVQAVVALLWLLHVNSDPVSIYWQGQGDHISLDHFNLVPGTKGKTVDWTVWPALVRGDPSGGSDVVVRKGVILPIK